MAVQWIAFHLTDRCNLNCTHCLRDPDLKAKDLRPEVISSVLAQASAHYGTRHVALTGGEPTLHPKFPEIIDIIVGQQMSWHVVTNGTTMPRLLDWVDASATRRQGLTAVDLSLDGAEEATHDRVRGAGSYALVLGAAAALQARGIPLVLQMTVHRWNEPEIEAFGLMAAQLGAERVSFSWMQPTGTHWDEELGLSARAWRLVRDRIERLRSVLNIEVGMPEGWPTGESFHVCEPFRYQTLHVDVEGRLNLCCQHSGIPAEGATTDVVASLENTSLEDAHGHLVDLVHETQKRNLQRMSQESQDDWFDFHCNNCMKLFGKPHWTDDGVSGGGASRQRWRGAWDGGATGTVVGKRRLSVVT